MGELVHGMSNRDYHAEGKYFSSSQLKYLNAKSPAHFKAKYIDKILPEKGQSEAMVLGSLVHTLVLEPLNFAKEYVVSPTVDRRTKEGKAQWIDFLASNPGKTLIEEELLDKATLMHDSVFKNQEAKALLVTGEKEESYFWKCQGSGLNFKARLDQVCPKWFVELKTTADASPQGFQKQAYNLGYDISLYHYREGLRAVKDIEPPAYFVCVESEAPYVCQVYKAGDSFWELGHERWLNAITRLEQAVRENKWQSYEASEQLTLEAPAWTVKKEEVIKEFETEESLF